MDEDYYSQPGNLFRLMRPEQKAQLFGNTAPPPAVRRVRFRFVTSATA
jgi:catalase